MASVNKPAKMSIGTSLRASTVATSHLCLKRHAPPRYFPISLRDILEDETSHLVPLLANCMCPFMWNHVLSDTGPETGQGDF